MNISPVSGFQSANNTKSRVCSKQAFGNLTPELERIFSGGDIFVPHKKPRGIAAIKAKLAQVEAHILELSPEPTDSKSSNISSFLQNLYEYSMIIGPGSPSKVNSARKARFFAQEYDALTKQRDELKGRLDASAAKKAEKAKVKAS